MEGSEIDRGARQILPHFVEPGGVAVDRNDLAHLPRRNERRVTAAELEQRIPSRELQLDLRDLRRRHPWLHDASPDP